MAIETIFKNIADAIREKAGTSGLITPAQMPQAIADIPSGGGGIVLTALTPLASDWQGGYCAGSTYYRESTPYYSDIYEIKNNSRYIATFGSEYGYFRRICATASNPLLTTTNLTGENYSNGYNSDFSYNPVICYLGSGTGNRYLTFTKANSTRDPAGIPTYVFELAELP